MGILDGKVAIVTGASRGIGAEIARRFAGEGAAVAVAARTTETGTSPLAGTITETVEQIRAAGGTAVGSAPGGSFATATGMNSVARQIGAALGVAIVVAVIGTPTPATAHAAFQHAWIFGAVCLFAAGLGCVLVGRVTAGQAPVPADAAPEVLAEAGAPPDRVPALSSRISF